MIKLSKHIDQLFKDVPDGEQKETIKQEILQNLEEKVHDLMMQDKEEEDAINKTIVEFGDIEDIKKELGVKEHIEQKTEKKDMSKLNLGFSLWGSALIITFFIFLNFYYSPETIWFVYPTFGVLWWPLAMFFAWERTK
ncbi:MULTISPECIES: permease prefix domain 1-containing protein [Bacillus]|uniref:2TM domain-containing protein n=2 Tax=Bacillus TaxID=1386 RepID=A0A0M4FMN2_9BACI|nr:MULTISPECIES: permease prefix domain 1-containing protein [Bacillus]ALC83641.1 hypothetical protein AM592_20515 [Bacillus gobiensis]MBP1082659.1 type I site-specific restriction-modification system R (restriction) subunit [Bacillus capparidis]MED1097114.1 permease prefix domain 1-containing protein [Bacillus capparidis]